MLGDQNDFYSLFREKSNKNKENRNLVTMKQYFNILKVLYCNRKLQYLCFVYVTVVTRKFDYLWFLVLKPKIIIQILLVKEWKFYHCIDN